MKSDKEKKEWEAKSAAFTGDEGSNKRKSGPLGYKGFVSKSMEVQKKWHALNQRALSKGHIDKLPGVVRGRAKPRCIAEQSAACFYCAWIVLMQGSAPHICFLCPDP